MTDGGGSNTPVRTFYQHLGESPGDQATADQAADRDQEALAEGQPAQLAP
jgi:hypothetical protein